VFIADTGRRENFLGVGGYVVENLLFCDGRVELAERFAQSIH